jgi:hypothetical protein
MPSSIFAVALTQMSDKRHHNYAFRGWRRVDVR